MIVALFLLGLLAVGDPPAAATPVPIKAAADAGADSIALHLAPIDERMTVAVTINGAGPFRFIVDSGATRTVISSRLAALLALPAGDPVTLHSVGGEAIVPTSRIAALALGTLPPQPVMAPVLDEANLGAAGILGIDVLAGKKVVIDLRANRMTIERSDRRAIQPTADEIVVTAIRRHGQLVLVDADAAGLPVRAVVDTGSMVTIGNGRLQDRLVRRRRIAPQPVFITDVTGRQVPALYAPITDIRLADWHVRNSEIAFSDAHCFARFGLAGKPAMLLGMDMMRVFSRVSIDFGRRSVRLLRRNEAEAAIPDPTAGPG